VPEGDGGAIRKKRLASLLTIVPNTIGIYGRDAEKCAECTQAGGTRSHISML
jgi:hypothetical protein